MRSFHPALPSVIPSLRSLTRRKVRAWLEDSCARGGVPVVVSDGDALRKVGVLLGRDAPLRSDAPDRLNARRIEEVPAPQCWSNDGVVEEDLDDGALPTEREVPPLSA